MRAQNSNLNRRKQRNQARLLAGRAVRILPEHLFIPLKNFKLVLCPQT